MRNYKRRSVQKTLVQQTGSVDLHVSQHATWRSSVLLVFKLLNDHMGNETSDLYPTQSTLYRRRRR